MKVYVALLLIVSLITLISAALSLEDTTTADIPLENTQTEPLPIISPDESSPAIKIETISSTWREVLKDSLTEIHTLVNLSMPNNIVNQAENGSSYSLDLFAVFDGLYGVNIDTDHVYGSYSLFHHEDTVVLDNIEKDMEIAGLNAMVKRDNAPHGDSVSVDEGKYQTDGDCTQSEGEDEQNEKNDGKDEILGGGKTDSLISLEKVSLSFDGLTNLGIDIEKNKNEEKDEKSVKFLLSLSLAITHKDYGRFMSSLYHSELDLAKSGQNGQNGPRINLFVSLRQIGVVDNGVGVISDGVGSGNGVESGVDQWFVDKILANGSSTENIDAGYLVLVDDGIESSGVDEEEMEEIGQQIEQNINDKSEEKIEIKDSFISFNNDAPGEFTPEQIEAINQLGLKWSEPVATHHSSIDDNSEEKTAGNIESEQTQPTNSPSNTKTIEPLFPDIDYPYVDGYSADVDSRGRKRVYNPEQETLFDTISNVILTYVVPCIVLIGFIAAVVYVVRVVYLIMSEKAAVESQNARNLATMYGNDDNTVINEQNAPFSLLYDQQYDHKPIFTGENSDVIVMVGKNEKSGKKRQYQGIKLNENNGKDEPLCQDRNDYY